MENFQMFKSVLQLDILRGWHNYKKKLLVFLSIILIIIIGSISIISRSGGNLSDLFFMIFRDIVFEKNELYIPVNWFLINIFIMFILGDFIHDNLRKDSTYLLLRIKKKTIFWLSKCVWIILNIIFIYTILITITFLLGGLFLGFRFSNMISSQIISEVEHINIILSMIFLYILTSITVLLIQCRLSIIMNSKYSFTIVAIILSLSIVSTFKLLLGTHSMILRHDYFNSELGISVQFSILYTLLLSVGTIFLGNKLLQNKDFI